MLSIWTVERLNLRDDVEVPEEASCDRVPATTGRSTSAHENDVDDLSELQRLAVVPDRGGVDRRNGGETPV